MTDQGNSWCLCSNTEEKILLKSFPPKFAASTKAIITRTDPEYGQADSVVSIPPSPKGKKKHTGKGC